MQHKHYQQITDTNMTWAQGHVYRCRDPEDGNVVVGLFSNSLRIKF